MRPYLTPCFYKKKEKNLIFTSVSNFEDCLDIYETFMKMSTVKFMNYSSSSEFAHNQPQDILDQYRWTGKIFCGPMKVKVKRICYLDLKGACGMGLLSMHCCEVISLKTFEGCSSESWHRISH